MKYLTNLDLSQNQLLNAVLQKLATDPVSPVAGQLYYNTASNTLRFYTGTAWKNAGEMTGNDIITLLNSSTLSIVDARLSAAAQQAIANAHTHSNKTILDAISAAFTATYETKLNGIEANADITDAVNVGLAINNTTAKTTLVDADVVAILDSAASNVLKKITFANVKAVLKTYFDTLYNAYSHPTGDGNLHVPATGTTNNGKVLMAGSTAGSISWTQLSIANVSGLQAALDAKETPTAAQNKANTAENNAKAYADSIKASILGGAGSAFDTLKELQDALGSDANFATSITTLISSKAGKATAIIGDGTTTAFNISHTLNTQDVSVFIRENASPYSQIITDVEITSTTSIKVSFAIAPSTNQYKVIIIG